MAIKIVLNGLFALSNLPYLTAPPPTENFLSAHRLDRRATLWPPFALFAPVRSAAFLRRLLPARLILLQQIVQELRLIRAHAVEVFRHFIHRVHGGRDAGSEATFSTSSSNCFALLINLIKNSDAPAG